MSRGRNVEFRINSVKYDVLVGYHSLHEEAVERCVFASHISNALFRFVVVLFLVL